MNLEITLDCPNCGKVIDISVPSGHRGALFCPECGKGTGYSTDGNITSDLMVEKCVRCGCTDLYWQSDFNRRLGFGFLVGMIALSVWMFYEGAGFWAILPMLAGVLVDGALYLLLPIVTCCYRCNAQYRNNKPNPKHGPHDLHLQEEYEHEARKKAEAEGREFDPRVPHALYVGYHAEDSNPNTDPENLHERE